MAKPTVEVDKALLTLALNRAEANGAFDNLSLLWNKTAEIYNSLPKIPDQITHSIVYLRVNQWKIPHLTKSGKKGRQGPMTEEHKAAMRAAREASGGRTPRKEKMKAFADSFAAMRKEFPESRELLIERAENGSLKAAANAFCISCGGFSANEVKLCLVMACPLYPYRPGAVPYKKALHLVQLQTQKELKIEPPATTVAAT